MMGRVPTNYMLSAHYGKGDGDGEFLVVSAEQDVFTALPIERGKGISDEHCDIIMGIHKRVFLTGNTGCTMI